MKLFGRAKKAPTPKDSIQKLRETLEMLEKREEFLQKKMDREIVIAKQNATKNKRGLFKISLPPNDEHNNVVTFTL